MSDNQLVQRSADPEVAKTSHNPLDESTDAGVAARGQSAEVGQALVQRKGGNGAGAGADLNGVVGQATQGGGSPIPHKAAMETAFGRSFDDVKAHTGGAAAGANKALGSEAFATGNDIAFKGGSPSKELVAHELTHVVQQGGKAGGVQHKMTLGSSSSSFEQEADQVASTVAGGGKVDTASISQAPAGLVSRKTEMPKKFDEMWAAHPHNYQQDESQNTSSDDVNKAAGFDPAAYQNTCAIRLSVMWNKLGGNYKITKQKGIQAGLAPGRIVYSKKQDWWYILSAKEMWTYVSYHFGKPHKTFPNGKRFKNAEEYDKAWEAEIKPYISSRQGVVAFDKIFGYGGTGHVDIFNGETLSDSSSWYQCQQVKLWFIAT